MSWTLAGMPFLSFFDSWTAALKWRSFLLSKGYRNVEIIAIWAWDLHFLYKAADIARTLGYRDGNYDHPFYRRRQLSYFKHEYLVWGSILADEYRILAVFFGDNQEE